MENIQSYNNVPILITPLMHREVVKSRTPDYTYSAVRERIERDREAISVFLQKIRPFAYHDNLNRLGNRPASAEEPYWGNGWFDAGDARAAYGIVGAFKPNRIIEIGSGNSTKFMRRSIRDFALKTHLTSIDPAPRAEIDSICDTIIRRSILDVDLDIFLSLEPGDILFHDGSHLTFNGTDTVRLFLEILPKVAPGVLIQIHDICLPGEYVKAYDGRGYSEQYMLAAALMFSDQLEVVLPVAYLAKEESFESGGSFWLRKKQMPSNT
jgi:hypothetical protein